MTVEEVAPLPGEGDAADLASTDFLLGVPVRSLFTVRALRGLGYVVLGLVLVAWEGRSIRLIGVIAGLATLTYAASTAIDVLRRPPRREFWTILSIGVTGGFGFALVLHPVNALDSFIQTIGGAAVAWAFYGIVTMIRRRAFTAWMTTKVVALVALGATFIIYDKQIFTFSAMLLVTALLVVGVYQIFTIAPETDTGARSGTESGSFGSTWADRARELVQRQPVIAEDRAVLQQNLFFEGDETPSRMGRFAVLMTLAGLIATFGVVVESTAVVIGAMLIAPLMTPLLGMALAATTGWLRRFRRASAVAMTGLIIAIATGVVVGAITPGQIDIITNPQVVARTSPTLLDLVIAIAAGAAGAFAVSRRDVSDSLPGVAVAISLVPPLAVVGLCWQQGQWVAGNGALLLFLTNATAILVAGGLVFVLVGAAPIDRISEGQERVATLIVSLLLGAGVVVMLLVLNGGSAARVQLASTNTHEILSGWNEQHPDFRVVDQRTLADGTIEVDLTGPGRPPGLDALRDQLSEELPSGMRLRISWYPREEIMVTGN